MHILTEICFIGVWSKIKSWGYGVRYKYSPCVLFSSNPNLANFMRHKLSWPFFFFHTLCGKDLQIDTGADTGFHCEIWKREDNTKKEQKGNFIDRANTKKVCRFV